MQLIYFYDTLTQPYCNQARTLIELFALICYAHTYKL